VDAGVLGDNVGQFRKSTVVINKTKHEMSSQEKLRATKIIILNTLNALIVVFKYIIVCC